VIQKLFRLCLLLSFLHLKPNFKVLKFEFCRINLQLTGKSSLDSWTPNSSLLFLEYGCKLVSDKNIKTALNG